MRCKYCGFGNGNDDHRCTRCGRRLSVVIAAPAEYSGANALAPALTAATDAQEFAAAGPAERAQTALFSGGTPKVIPFDQIQRQATGRLVVQHPLAPAHEPPAGNGRDAPRKILRPLAEQTTLDFIPPALPRARKLKTEIEAQVFCEQPVATPMHRLIAASIDTAAILLGFGVMTTGFLLLGGDFGSGKLLFLAIGGSLALIALFYGLLWAITGRETAGMRATELHLITFDGFPLDARARALRFGSTWLSFFSAGLGLVWALADEENLTWHDHISKTFQTIRETPRTFVKQKQ